MRPLTAGAANGSGPGVLIGIAGLNSSGKGEVVRYLVERSFYALSLSDVIRGQLVERGLEETRERMIETGNTIRAALGAGGLAQRDQCLLDSNVHAGQMRHSVGKWIHRCKARAVTLDQCFLHTMWPVLQASICGPVGTYSTHIIARTL